MHKPDIAALFDRIADELSTINAAPDPTARHLLVKIQAREMQAAKAMQAAADAGHFAGESWWRGNQCPIETVFRFDNDEERYLLLWVFALGSWLYRDYPTDFPHKAPELYWVHHRLNPNYRALPIITLDANGEPIRKEWHADEKLQATVVEESLTEADCHAHLRERATVDAAACRLLARIVRNKAIETHTLSGASGRTVPNGDMRDSWFIVCRLFEWGGGPTETNQTEYVPCYAEGYTKHEMDTVFEALNKGARRGESVNLYCEQDLGRADALLYRQMAQNVEECAARYKRVREVVDAVQFYLTDVRAKRTDVSAPGSRRRPRKPRPRGLCIAESKRRATFDGKELNINAQADFRALQLQHERGDALVPYKDLLLAIKPSEKSDVPKLIKLPPEVKEAMTHINRELKNAGAPFYYKAIRGEGYQRVLRGG